jgi:hypothetical protein
METKEPSWMTEPGFNEIVWGAPVPAVRARLVRRNNAAVTAALMIKRPKSFFTKFPFPN